MTKRKGTAQFSPDIQVRKHAKLFAELFEHVLSEEEPLFDVG
jgi:hypothetical protein